MGNHDNYGQPEEIVALYATGALSPDDMAAFESHLSDGCKECLAALQQINPTIEALFDSVEPVEPGKDVRASMMKRIEDEAKPSKTAGKKEVDPQVWKKWQGESLEDDIVIRDAIHTGWEETGIAGIRVRRLNVDVKNDRMTMLVRMEPGTAYPEHRHGGPEECLVLEGTLRAGNRLFKAGDYQRMGLGTDHCIQSTDDGCLLMIVSSLSDQLIGDN